jgi:hypothetical protein
VSWLYVAVVVWLLIVACVHAGLWARYMNWVQKNFVDKQDGF